MVSADRFDQKIADNVGQARENERYNQIIGDEEYDSDEDREIDAEEDDDDEEEI